MIPSLFSPKPGHQETVFAEAQNLLDDGLDVDFVIGLYPDDAEWLEPLLRTADDIMATLRAEEPSFYFEGSLKNRFLAAGAERARERANTSALGGKLTRLRAASAAMAVVAGGAIVGVLTLGFVTADNAVPGDWNYMFKTAGERVEYVLADEPERFELKLKHKQERIAEIEKLVSRGDLSASHIQRLQRELEDVSHIGDERPLNPEQQASVRALGETSTEILTTVRENRPELANEVETAIGVAASIADGGAGLGALDEPSATPEPTDEPAAEPTATATPEATATPVPTEETVTPPTATSEPSRTPTPQPTRTPSPTETPDDGDQTQTPPTRTQSAPEPTADEPG